MDRDRDAVLAPLLNFLEIGLAIHDVSGAPLFSNDAAKSLLVGERHEIERTIQEALGRDNIGVVAASGSTRICSVATGSHVFTFLHHAGQLNLRLSACMFGLTPMEEQIAILLARGKTARQIATTLNVSLHTVHSHLRSLFGKTHTHSQNELVALLSGGLSLIAIEEVRALSPTIKGCANKSSEVASAVQHHNRGERSR